MIPARISLLFVRTPFEVLSLYRSFFSFWPVKDPALMAMRHQIVREVARAGCFASSSSCFCRRGAVQALAPSI